MKKRLTAHWLAFLTLAILLSWSVHAPAKATPTFMPLGIGDANAGTAAGALPSEAHPSGTLYIAYAGPLGTDAQPLVVGEWGIAERRFLRKTTLTTCSIGSCKATVARAGDKVVVLAGAPDNSSEEPIHLFVLGPDLAVHDQLTVGHGGMPQMAIAGGMIVVGAYEERTPVVAPIVTRDLKIQPSSIFAVRAIAVDGLRILGSRVFRGSQLLRPHFVRSRAAHALAVVDGKAYIALADREPTVVKVRLPSLATEAQKVFPREHPSLSDPASVRLDVVGHTILSTGHGGKLLSPTLDVLATPAEENVLGSDAARGIVFTSSSSRRSGPISFRAVPVPDADDGIEPNVVVLGNTLVVTASVDDGGRADTGMAVVR